MNNVIEVKVEQSTVSTVSSAPDNTPHAVVDKTVTIEPSYYVKQHIKSITKDLLEYSRNLNPQDIVRYKLAESMINTHSEYITYVAENEKEGKRIFKNVVSKFCEMYNLGSISMGMQELIYNDTLVIGFISFNFYTDKTFGFNFIIDETLANELKLVINTRENANSTPILSRLSVDSRNNMMNNNILFNAPKINMPSEIMYPWFDHTPEDFALKFMESNSNVLVLYGDPGTGKTTFIKRMLSSIGFETDRTINIIDTPGVMESPDMVNRIYTSKHKDIFVFEDVDRHLYSRKEGNDIMAGLLNAAEGLASPDVKMIISTNIKNLSEIDSALIRPGRCFKTLEFVKLLKHEQINVREFLGLDLEACTNERQSLAEVMNEKATEKLHSFGFANS